MSDGNFLFVVSRMEWNLTTAWTSTHVYMLQVATTFFADNLERGCQVKDTNFPSMARSIFATTPTNPSFYIFGFSSPNLTSAVHAVGGSGSVQWYLETTSSDHRDAKSIRYRRTSFGPASSNWFGGYVNVEKGITYQISAWVKFLSAVPTPADGVGFKVHSTGVNNGAQILNTWLRDATQKRWTQVFASWTASTSANELVLFIMDGADYGTDVIVHDLLVKEKRCPSVAASASTSLCGLEFNSVTQFDDQMRSSRVGQALIPSGALQEFVNIAPDNGALVVSANLDTYGNYVFKLDKYGFELQGPDFAIGIGSISDPDDSTRSDSCKSLAGVLDDPTRPSSYFFMDLHPSDEVQGKIKNVLKTNEAADIVKKERTCDPCSTEKSKTMQANKQVTPGFKSKPSAKTRPSTNFPFFPVCLAIRPCGKLDTSIDLVNSLGGVYFGSGLTLVNAGQFGSLVFYGAAVSLSGELVPFKLEPQLIDNYQPLGMHLWAQLGWSFPFTRVTKDSLKVNLFTLELVGDFGFFAQVMGERKIGALLQQLTQGPSPDELMNWLRERSLGVTSVTRFQIFGTIGFKFKLYLGKILGLKSDFPIELGNMITTGTGLDVGKELAAMKTPSFKGKVAAFMLDFQLTPGKDFESWIDMRFTMQSLSLKDILTQLLKPLGKFGELITGNIGDSAGAQLRFRNKLRYYFDNKIDLAFDVKLTLGLYCGPLKGLLDIVKGLVNELKHLGANEINDFLNKYVTPVVDILDRICSTSMTFELGLGFVRNQIDRKNTFISFQMDGLFYTRLSLDMIPECKIPDGWDGIAPGEKCSKNTDCTGSYYPNGGYCLNDATWKTSVACLGTCIHKLREGALCDADSMNLPFFQAMDLSNTEHQACISNKCICGRCATLQGLVPNGSRLMNDVVI
jgi:hypothetical protein